MNECQNEYECRYFWEEKPLPIFRLAISDNPEHGVKEIILSKDSLMPWVSFSTPDTLKPKN